MSRNSSMVGSAGGTGGSVMSVVASAGGAFHGHTIESWDVERHIESLREEVKESLDESRRAKLYCQQVKKEMAALVDTDLDARQDNEMLGGISMLLSNTNTLVEKFAAFELYLREKIAAEQDARDARVLREAQESSNGHTDALRDDVRETLKSFKKEILGLRQEQQERYATCDDAIRVLRGDMETTVSDSNRSVYSRLSSHIDVRFSEAEKFTNKEILGLRQEQNERLTAFADTIREVRSEIDHSVSTASRSVHSKLSSHIDVRFSEAEKFTNKEVLCLRQEQNERLTKLDDTIREARAEIEASVTTASRSVHAKLTSMMDQRFSDAEQNTGSGIANMQSVLTALEQRAMESVASLKKFVTASLSDVRIVIDEATAAAVTRFNQQLASHAAASDATVADIRRSLAAQTKALADDAAKRTREIDDVHRAVAAATEEVQSTLDARIGSVERTVQRRLHVLETESVVSVSADLTALDHRVTVELADRDASLRADLQGMQDVFIAVFGPHCLPHSSTADMSTSTSSTRSHAAGGVGTLEASLDRQKRQILEELLHTHIKTIQETATAHSASTAALRQHVLHQAAMWLNATVHGRQRSGVFHRWVAFARCKQAARVRMRAAQRQRAVQAIERSMVPQLSTALRRVTLAKWKRFLVLRRNATRLGRIAQNLATTATRRTVGRYLATWLRLVHRVRRPAKLSHRLQVQSELSLGKRWFRRWCRFAVSHQKHRRLQRDAHLLALASATSSHSYLSPGMCPPQVSAIQHNVSHSTQRSLLLHNDGRGVRHRGDSGGAPHYWLGTTPPSPRDAMLLRNTLQQWVAHCWRRRYVRLHRTVVATDALVEAARNDMRCVVGDIGSLRDAQNTFQQRVAAIVLHNAAGASAHQHAASGVDGGSRTKGVIASPGKGLANSIQLLHDGYASIHDVFRCLSLWVDVVERTQRGLVRDVANLQAWSAAVEEEIRRVQTFVRPPFK